MASIDIAMPTYNRGPWLNEFMNSLLAQDFRDWRLVVRDDRSSDDTAKQLDRWQACLGERMTILPGSAGCNLGVVGNYNAVLAACTADQVMTADADDVWLPGKISTTLKAMSEAEARFGTKTPISVYSDARVVDESAEPVSPSYWRLYRMNPRLVGRPVRTAMESLALGSTMMVNRALLKISLPIGAGAPYQDWWLALVAAAFGRTIALPEATILYRRHGTNQTKGPYTASLWKALLRALSAPAVPRRRIHQLLAQAAGQAADFVERFQGRLDPQDLFALQALARLPEQGPLAGRVSIVRHGFWFGSTIKNIGLLILF